MARPKFEIDDREREVYTGGGGKSMLTIPGGLEIYKPRKSGAFRIEIIPFQVGPAINKFRPDLRLSSAGKWHWNVMYRSHFGVGPDNQMVVCPGTFNKPCPICERRSEISRHGTPESKQAAKAFNSKERQLILVCERGDRDGQLGPIQLWDISTFNFRKQLWPFLDNADREDYEEWQRFWWPDQGMTMKVMGTEESHGGGGTFSKYAPMELKRRKEPLPEDLFYHGYELYGMVRERGYDEIRAMMSGAAEDEGDGDDPAPRYADKSASKGRASAPPRDDADEPDLPVKPARSAGYESAAGNSTPAAKPRTAPKPPVEEDADSEPAPKVAKKPKCVSVADDYDFTGDETIWLERNGKWIECEITSLDATARIVRLKVDGANRPVTLDYEEAVLQIATIPEAPTPKSKAAPKAPKNEDPEPEEAPVAKAKPRTAPVQVPDDDDDNLPLPPKRRG